MGGQRKNHTKAAFFIDTVRRALGFVKNKQNKVNSSFLNVNIFVFLCSGLWLINKPQVCQGGWPQFDCVKRCLAVSVKLKLTICHRTDDRLQLFLL